MHRVPRKPRIQYPGAIYHVMSRGDRREDIYLDDVDRHDFLKTLAEACQKTGWQVRCEHDSGELRREAAQAKGERIVGEELRLAPRKPARYWFSCVFYA